MEITELEIKQTPVCLDDGQIQGSYYRKCKYGPALYSNEGESTPREMIVETEDWEITKISNDGEISHISINTKDRDALLALLSYTKNKIKISEDNALERGKRLGYSKGLHEGKKEGIETMHSIFMEASLFARIFKRF